jgi:hypothetical protein
MKGGSAGEQKSGMRVQIQYEIDKQLLNSRYYTRISMSIIFSDNLRKCHHVMVDGLRFRSGWLENMELLCAVSRQMAVTASLLTVLTHTKKGQF